VHFFKCKDIDYLYGLNTILTVFFKCGNVHSSCTLYILYEEGIFVQYWRRNIIANAKNCNYTGEQQQQQQQQLQQQQQARMPSLLNPSLLTAFSVVVLWRNSHYPTNNRLDGQPLQKCNIIISRVRLLPTCIIYGYNTILTSYRTLESVRRWFMYACRYI